MIATFPHHTLRGSHREVGRQHGEALRPLIRAHLELIYTQGARKSQLEPETARRWALAFGPVIGETAPHFLEEIGDGCLVHANHHVLPGMACHETATPEELHNSTCRHERIAALMEATRGRLDGDTLQTILRDHANRPHSICAHPGERVSYSFASLIADLDAGSMEIAVGPPCKHEYARYEVRA